MANYQITAPDGTKYQITAPDSASQADVLAYAQSQHVASNSAPATSSGPQPTIGQTIAASSPVRLAHDAILAPLEGAASMAAKYLPVVGSSTLGSAVDAGIGAIEKPYQAAIAAQQNRPGYAAARAQADKVVQDNGRGGFTDQLTAPFSPAIAGTVGGLFGGSGGNLNAMNASADAQATSQAGYAKAHPIKAAIGNVVGGLAAVPEGATTAALATPQIAKPFIPSLNDLKSASRAAYKQVDNSGLVINGSSYDKMVSDLQANMDKLGIDPDLHPDATAVMGRLSALKGDPAGSVPFQKLNSLRELAGDAAGATLPRDAMRGNVIQDHIDDFVDNLAPADIVGGTTDPTATVNTLNDARDLYSRAKQTETIQSVLDKADIKAPGYSQSGAENSIRSGFRQLALNDSKMRRLSPDLQQQVIAVAKGTPITNLLRTIGKAAPRGIVSGTLAPGAGFLAGGPVGGLAAPIAGELALRGATAMTKAAANKALQTASLGSRLPSLPAALKTPALTNQSRLPLGLFGSSLYANSQ